MSSCLPNFEMQSEYRSRCVERFEPHAEECTRSGARISTGVCVDLVSLNVCQHCSCIGIGSSLKQNSHPQYRITTFIQLQDRADITFVVNDLCQRMSDPSQRSFNKVKRLARYLKGERQWIQVFELGNMSSEVTFFSDSGWVSNFIRDLQKIVPDQFHKYIDWEHTRTEQGTWPTKKLVSMWFKNETNMSTMIGMLEIVRNELKKAPYKLHGQDWK